MNAGLIVLKIENYDMRYFVLTLTLFLFLLVLVRGGNREKEFESDLIVVARIEADTTIHIQNNSYRGFRIRISHTTSPSFSEGSTVNVLWSDMRSALTGYRRAKPEIGSDYVFFLRRLREANVVAYKSRSASLVFDERMFDWPPPRNVGHALIGRSEADTVIAGTVLGVTEDSGNIISVQVDNVYRHTRIEDFSPSGGTLGIFSIQWNQKTELPEAGERYVLFLERVEKVQDLEPYGWKLIDGLSGELFYWPPDKVSLEVLFLNKVE